MSSIEVLAVEEDADVDDTFFSDYQADLHFDQDNYQSDLLAYSRGSFASHTYIGCGTFLPRTVSLRGSLSCGPVMGLGRNRQVLLSADNKSYFISQQTITP
jgi:hypothetical protein